MGVFLWRELAECDWHGAEKFFSRKISCLDKGIPEKEFCLEKFGFVANILRHDIMLGWNWQPWLN